MSHTETHYGKLRRVQIPREMPLEEWYKQKCEEKGVTKISTYNKSWKEQFRDHYYEKFFVIDETVWEAVEHVEAEEHDIDIMIPNLDQTITFVQQFYNGGTCLSEVIENGIRDLQKQQRI